MQIQITVCPNGYWQPQRVHPFRDWMNQAYHKRIQKKWTKRWGATWVEPLKKGQILQSGDGIICRADDYHMLQQAVNGQG